MGSSRVRDRRDRRRRRSRSRSRRRLRSRDHDRRRRRRSRSRSPGRSRRSRSPRRRDSRPCPPQPNPDLIKQLLSQQQLGASPQATRQARRVYVGNMPIGAGFTEAALVQFFTDAAVSAGITTPNPVLSVWSSADGSFCFVEMRAVSDSTRSIDRWDSLQLGGRQLRVGRPADYTPAPPHLGTYVVEVAGLQPAPEDCTGRMRASTFPPPAGLMPLTAGSSAEATRVLLLLNVVKREELLDTEEYDDIILDVREEFEKFGAVDDLWVPRPSAEGLEYDPPGVGKVLVAFSSVADAVAARQSLSRRVFNNRTIDAIYFPVRQFEDRVIQ